MARTMPQVPRAMTVESQAMSDDGRVRRAERSGRAIVEALMGLVGEGVLEPTAQQVASRAGVGIRTVFRRFSDMESLFAEISARLRAESLPVLNGDRPGGALATRARTMVGRRGGRDASAHHGRTAGRVLRARRAVQACGELEALAIALSPRRPREPRARTTCRSAALAPRAASCARGRGRGARSRDVVRGLGSTAHGAAPRPRPRAARGRAHGRRPRRPAAPSGWREQRMTRRGSGDAGVYRVHGMMQSYFTRKMTGYLDYKGIPWVFRRFAGASPEATA